MFEYLQTKEGLCNTAIVAGLLILAAFILGAHPFRRKKRLVLAKTQQFPQWYASECFMFLKATIMTCTTPDELKKCRSHVEIFYDRKFRAPISTRERKRYYTRLLEAIALKEELLNQSTFA
jgi:hypothetical protein